MGETVGLMKKAVIGGERVGEMCEVSGGWWGGSFRANKSGCRVSRGKNGQGKSQKSGGEGRWREENGIRKNQGQTKRGQGRVGGESEGDRQM
jgi:hypothetical protein